MIVPLFVMLILVKSAVSQNLYASVLAEQLNQFCVGQCHSAAADNPATRIGKAGPRGLRGLIGPPGPVGGLGPIGPRGPVGFPGTVNYTLVTDLVKAHVDKVMAPVTCSDTREIWQTSEGVFDIYSPTIGKRIKVYCDHVADGGNWTVFQRRMDGSQNFQRNWNEYVMGFGNLYGEFWMELQRKRVSSSAGHTTDKMNFTTLDFTPVGVFGDVVSSQYTQILIVLVFTSGLETLHRLTSQGKYELRVDLRDWEGNSSYAVYSVFSVDGLSNQYRLNVNGYSGDAGDSLTYHNNRRFTTSDKDNDAHSGNCAGEHGGGWWFGNCDHSNLNGIYHNGGKYSGDENGVEWHHWKSWYSMKFTEMKFRPKI